MKLRVVKTICPRCFRECEAVRIHEDFKNKIKDRIEGVQCVSCRYFEYLDLFKEEKTLKLL